MKFENPFHKIKKVLTVAAAATVLSASPLAAHGQDGKAKLPASGHEKYQAKNWQDYQQHLKLYMDSLKSWEANQKFIKEIDNGKHYSHFVDNPASTQSKKAYEDKVASAQKAGMGTIAHQNNPMEYIKDATGSYVLRLSPKPYSMARQQGDYATVRTYYRNEADIIQALDDLVSRDPGAAAFVQNEKRALMAGTGASYDFSVRLVLKPVLPIAPLSDQLFYIKEQQQKQQKSDTVEVSQPQKTILKTESHSQETITKTDSNHIVKPSVNFPRLVEVYTKDTSGNFIFNHYEEKATGKRYGTNYHAPKAVE